MELDMISTSDDVITPYNPKYVLQGWLGAENGPKYLYFTTFYIFCLKYSFNHVIYRKI